MISSKKDRTNHDEKARKTRAFSRIRTKKGVGIQWRLLGYLSLFVAFILIVLWVFQVALLIPFYKNIKNRELEKTADTISDALSAMEGVSSESMTDFNGTLWDVAERYSVCVTIWRVEDEHARFFSVADVSDDCLIHKVTAPKRFIEMYQMAKSNGGRFSCQVKMHREGMIWMDGDGQILGPEGWDSEEDTNPLPNDSQADEDTCALHMRLMRGGDGAEYIILLDSELTPVNATVTTLKAQFSWIAAILLLAALLLAYLMSRRVSRPLIRMNEAAQTLAKGEYDVHFAGQGYRETRELAQTLNYAAEELSKIDRLQKELIANISHDLRTPLTLITGYGEVMRDLPDENTPENVQVIIDEATHLSALVNDLLDLSRLQSGMREARMEPIDLTETVRTLMHRYDRLISHDGYRISFSFDCEVKIQADRTMLLQVIYNLINNAINYCGEDKTVEVIQTLREDGVVRLSVVDHGEGISEEELPYIWDRYYKVDRVHRRAMIGTGLGLSIAKGALELHGANYGVNCRLGEGSEFWFEFPVDPAAPNKEMEETEDI